MFLRTPLDIGRAIRDQRKRLGLDQNELAQRVGATRKWLIDVEGGKPRTPIGLLLRTFDALGLRLSLETDRPAKPRKGQPKPLPNLDIDRILDRARSNRT